ncbi:Importin subunit beta-3 [Zancudomyces culisetae]|uniref:Importin subunit beta-3 n=1 Tax=Zancudomyces culisetae TaxID=1213189 RepID=A0A1R1PRQ0_ZANCU|nr:Importin subunit beta-3 [Zancudomyces culisetae]|eukprot:OMH83562.1 Importin subunit beta-3 [Zancudomyces culisetae]
MPSLLKSARMQPDFAVVDGDDDPNEQYAAEDGWEFASVSGQQIGIRTSALEEKCTAIEMLLCYARELGSGFGPYAVETLDLVMPLFNFYFHEGVRFASAAVVPHCLAALVGNVDSATSVAVFGRVVDAYLKAMIGESDDMTFVSQLFMTFSECLMVAGPGCLNGDQQQRVYQVMVELFEKVLASINSRNGNKSAAAAQGQGQGQGGNEDEEADVDVEVDDEMVLAENEAMDSISKCIRTIVKLHPGFVPYIDSLFPYFMQFSNDSTGYGLQWSLCVYDDLIEMMGPLSFKYAPSTFFPIFSTGISAIPTSPDVAQACLYGVGLMAQYGGQEYYPAIVSQFLPAIKSILLHHLSQKKAPAANVEDEEGYIFAIENATSSLLKIVLNLHDYLVSSNISVPDLLLLWFNSMPILQDDEEATLNYQFLLSLLTSSSSSPSSPSPSSLSFTSQIASKYPLASLLSLIPNNPTPAAIDSLVHLSTMVVDSLVLDFLPRDLGSQLLAGLNSFISSYSSSQDVKSQVWSRIPLDKQLSLHKLGYI